MTKKQPAKRSPTGKSPVKSFEEPRRWKKCGHLRTKENTCEVSERRPGGKCRECKNARNKRWRQTDKGFKAGCRHNLMQMATGYKYWYNKEYCAARSRITLSGTTYLQRWPGLAFALAKPTNDGSFIFDAQSMDGNRVHRREIVADVWIWLSGWCSYWPTDGAG